MGPRTHCEGIGSGFDSFGPQTGCLPNHAFEVPSCASALAITFVSLLVHAGLRRETSRARPPRRRPTARRLIDEVVLEGEPLPGTAHVTMSTFDWAFRKPRPVQAQILPPLHK